MTDPRTAVERLADALTKRMVDDGRLIEGGWVGLRAFAMDEDAPPLQVAEMRMAFFAGAQHLFGSIMSFITDGDEITEADMNRLTLIDAELRAFAEELSLRFTRPQGQG